MSSEELVKKIDADEYLLPADLQKQLTDEDLLRELEEIFQNYQSKLQSEVMFRRKYTELVSYLLGKNLTKDTKLIFDRNMINTLLAYPETV